MVLSTLAASLRQYIQSFQPMYGTWYRPRWLVNFLMIWSTDSYYHLVQNYANPLSLMDAPWSALILHCITITYWLYLTGLWGYEDHMNGAGIEANRHCDSFSRLFQYVFPVPAPRACELIRFTPRQYLCSLPKGRHPKVPAFIGHVTAQTIIICALT